MAAAVVAAAHERLNRRRRQRPHRRRWSGGSELGAEIVASMLFMLFMQAVRRSRVQEPLEDPRVARAPQTKRLQTIPPGVSFFSIQPFLLQASLVAVGRRYFLRRYLVARLCE